MHVHLLRTELFILVLLALLLCEINGHQVSRHRLLSVPLLCLFGINDWVRHLAFLVGQRLRTQILGKEVAINKFCHDGVVYWQDTSGLDGRYRIWRGWLNGNVGTFGEQRPNLRLLFLWSSSFFQPCLIFSCCKLQDNPFHRLLVELGLLLLLLLRRRYAYGIWSTSLEILRWGLRLVFFSIFRKRCGIPLST